MAYSINTTFGQIEKHSHGTLDHIVTVDSSFQTGRVQILNISQIILIKNGDSTLYSASQLREFSFYGNLFKSISVDGKFIFGKVLSSGGLSLYQSKDALYLNADGKIKLLDRARFRETLRPYTGYNGLMTLHLKPRSIKLLIDRTNNGTIGKYIPEWRLGLVFGPQFYRLRLKVPALDPRLFSTLGTSFMSGLYCDIPFYRSKRVSFSGELLYSQSQEKEFEIPINKVRFRSVASPLSLKWFTSLRSDLRTYFKSGLVPGLNFTKLPALKTHSTSVELGFLGSIGVEFLNPSQLLLLILN